MCCTAPVTTHAAAIRPLDTMRHKEHCYFRGMSGLMSVQTMEVLRKEGPELCPGSRS